jgi:hypothetical protein
MWETNGKMECSGMTDPRRLTCSPPAVVLSLVCAIAGGCAKSEQVERQSNLQAIAAYYSQFLAHHRGQLPANEEEFKKFIQAKGGEALSYKGLSVDELFVSSRDGKPFVVKYRGDKSWPLPDVIAYEQEGDDGIRHGATSVGEYTVISDEEFRSGKTHRAAANR